LTTGFFHLKGVSLMAVAEQSTNSRVWGITVRHVVFMALGAALYAGISYITNTLQLPGASNVSLRPGIVIPLFFGVVFGPWVGLFTGGVGNLLNDLFTGTVYWNWDLGNGLIGFVAGLALYFTWGRYNTFRNIAIAELFSVIGIIVGLGFAAFSDIWVSQLTPATAVTTEFIPATIPDIVLGLILLPILLVAYNAAMTRAGRA
jgi:energy-coupling factor transport system substrate-specific component